MNDKKLSVESLFSEYEETLASETSKKELAHAQQAAALQRFSTRLTAGVVPALNELADELRAKGCEVMLTVAGPGTGYDEYLAYPRAELQLTPPVKVDQFVLPSKIMFWCGPDKARELNTSVIVELQLKSGTQRKEIPFDIDKVDGEWAKQIVLTHFRDVLLQSVRRGNH